MTFQNTPDLRYQQQTNFSPSYVYGGPTSFRAGFSPSPFRHSQPAASSLHPSYQQVLHAHPPTQHGGGMMPLEEVNVPLTASFNDLFGQLDSGRLVAGLNGLDGIKPQDEKDAFIRRYRSHFHNPHMTGTEAFHNGSLLLKRVEDDLERVDSYVANQEKLLDQAEASSLRNVAYLKSQLEDAERQTNMITTEKNKLKQSKSCSTTAREFHREFLGLTQGHRLSTLSMESMRLVYDIRSWKDQREGPGPELLKAEFLRERSIEDLDNDEVNGLLEAMSDFKCGTNPDIRKNVDRNIHLCEGETARLLNQKRILHDKKYNLAVSHCFSYVTSSQFFSPFLFATIHR